MTHKLKCWTQFFQDVKSGRKPFEVRLNDRNFQVGDKLLLQEWLPLLKEYTEDEVTKEIIYILKGGQFGIETGYVVMTIK